MFFKLAPTLTIEAAVIDFVYTLICAFDFSAFLAFHLF